jgi:class 3 adenylate cyclase
MSLDKEFHDCFHNFLLQYCPDPDLIEIAIKRTDMWGIEDKNTGDIICKRGDQVRFCWFILKGRAEIMVDGRAITERVDGEMIGEQELLRSLVTRGDFAPATADIIARGRVRLARLSPGFQDKLNANERSAWGLTLAAVLNEKLQQATDERSKLQKFIDDRDSLLARFAEGEALGIVKRAAGDPATKVFSREVIVWFSDIANFSTWSTDKSPEETADLAKRLAQIQIDQIRAAGGEIDKLTGDGVMAIWFIDADADRLALPRRAVECAQAVVRTVRAELLRRKGAGALGIRIGMHCGPVSFGDFGAQDRIAVTVLGHVVNMAARYEQTKSEKLEAIRISLELKDLVDRDRSKPAMQFQGPIKVQVKHGVEIDVFSTT